ncbi:ATP-binding protein [Oceanobacillus salinisoli]|uniref:ATP-binding protein n=1 Tax=Oceanobacillus salinisoli TaxID=2678611 RepID=UPI001E3A5C3E|nr:ATP-binding protein [Oceanobacillus salinisoli]
MRFENIKTNVSETNPSLTEQLIDDQNKHECFSNYSMLPLTVLDWIENNQSEVIIVCDANGKIIFVSSSIERLLGYKKDELIGTYWHELLTAEESKYISKSYENIENINQCFTIGLIHKNGEQMSTECLLCKVMDNPDKKAYYALTLKDLTERKEAEEMLVRSEKMSVAGQLAAGVAHEIRNPLTSIKGFLQLLQAGVNRKEEYYKIMIEEIEKMEKITSELLFISKPMTDLKRIESVLEMIEDTVSLLQTQAKLNNIEIVVKQPITESVYCDKSQIKQVLINIVKNAIEAMGQSGEITISTHTTNDNISIHITDEGPGIPEEIIHKLGEPFFTTKKNGTGLGIMISKQILEEHHGSLEIMQNKDKGSTFKLNFPKEE